MDILKGIFFSNDNAFFNFFILEMIGFMVWKILFICLEMLCSKGYLDEWFIDKDVHFILKTIMFVFYYVICCMGFNIFDIYNLFKGLLLK